MEECHGQGAFADPLGGLVGRDERFGVSLRSHFTVAEKHKASRTLRVCRGLESVAVGSKVNINQSIEEFEAVFISCGKVSKKMVEQLEGEGLFVKKKSRGESKKD